MGWAKSMKKKTPVGGPGSDAYIRTKGGKCVCKGGKGCPGPAPRVGLRTKSRAKILPHRDLEADRAACAACAQRPRKRRLLFGRFQLHEAGDARGAAVVHQPEGMDGAEGSAELKNALGQGMQVGRAAQLLKDLGIHCGPMLGAAPDARLSSDA